MVTVGVCLLFYSWKEKCFWNFFKKKKRKEGREGKGGREGEREAKGRILFSYQSKLLAKSRTQKSMQSNSCDPNPHRINRQLKDYEEEQNVCSGQIENEFPELGWDCEDCSRVWYLNSLCLFSRDYQRDSRIVEQIRFRVEEKD